jgi:hypothetical protein
MQPANNFTQKTTHGFKLSQPVACQKVIPGGNFNKVAKKCSGNSG